MDSATLERKAEDISSQYIHELPDNYNGRHSAIADEATVHTLFKAAQLGLNDKDSALAAGLSIRTFQRWHELADAEPDSAYGTFIRELKACRAQGKLWHLENIKKHAEKLWVPSA